MTMELRNVPKMGKFHLLPCNHEVEAAIWANPARLKHQYGNASILRGSRAVFNICGNKFRLVTKINYPYSIVYVRFAGTHQDYDRIDAEEV